MENKGKLSTYTTQKRLKRDCVKGFWPEAFNKAFLFDKQRFITLVVKQMTCVFNFNKILGDITNVNK